MWRDSHSEGRGFESWHRILDRHFSHIFVVKIVMMFVWGDLTIRPKASGLSIMCVALSVTRLGEFWKFFASNFLLKVAQMYGDFSGRSKKYFFQVKTAVATFRAILGERKVGYFISTSGHTGSRWTNIYEDLAKMFFQNSGNREKNKLQILSRASVSTMGIRSILH